MFDREPVFISHFYRPQHSLASQPQSYQGFAAQNTGWQQLGGLNQQNVAFYQYNDFGDLD